MGKDDLTKMHEFPCFFCGEWNTLLFARNDSKTIHAMFRCYSCDSSIYIPRKICTKETLTMTTNNLGKKLGENFSETLWSIKENKNLQTGKLICPICFSEIDTFKPCKSKRPQYFWSCNYCFSRGYILSRELSKWKFISIMLLEENYNVRRNVR